MFHVLYRHRAAPWCDEVFSEMTDQTLTCRECRQEYIFTAGEQAFYEERGYTAPQRCASCRAARKAQNGDSQRSGGYSAGGNGGGYSNSPREMHATTCSDCGKATEVPFVPSSGKPVYCRECFQNQRQTTSRSNYSRY
jgi:CxxC-x17-CxxC domain-containing protein